MTRILPGVYTSIEDVSFLPEGNGALSVGVVLKANKGEVNKETLITNLNDFLSTYYYSGKPSIADDKTCHLCKEVLKYTNQLYVVRAANNPLYGGLIVKKEDTLGGVSEISLTPNTITVDADITALISAGDIIRVAGVSSTVDGRYTVVSATLGTNVTDVVVTEIPASTYSYTSGTKPSVYLTRQPIPFNQELIGEITGVSTVNKTFTIDGDVTNYCSEGDKILVVDSTGNDGVYTITDAAYVVSQTETDITVAETISSAVVDGEIYRHSIVEPENYTFKEEDLFIITGKDQGVYNGEFEIGITSYKESPESIAEAGTFELSIYNSNSNALLETFVAGRGVDDYSIDGVPLYIEEVCKNSNYIKVVNNSDVTGTTLPCNTVSRVQSSGGYDGDTLVDADLVNALSIFEDKGIPIDIVANGSTESETYQRALIDLAETRKDCIAFINSRLADESLATNSAKATAVVNYKKQNLASTSFYATMYAPHVTIPDIWNSRNVKVGADTKVLPAWLNVINQLGYPFAAAGTRYGKLQGISVDWKIGDQSGEGATLNDASVNFIAYDRKQGRYYLATQNTLQIANSALRDDGAVFNILDVKKTLQVYLTEYLNLPITDELRQEIQQKVDAYMYGLLAQDRFNGYTFQDITTATDVDNNTLNFILAIAPTRYAQKIYLKMQIVNSTFDFQILQRI